MAEPIRTTITKLNGENDQIWKLKAELVLIKEELWEQISTTMPTGATEAAAWKKKDDKARAKIGLLVQDSQLIHIRKATTAKQVWDSLKEYHEKSTLTSKIYLLRQICNLKLTETGCMERQITTMQDLVDKLTALGEEIEDHLFIAMLLSSLPDTYSTLITALESRPEAELTLALVKGKLFDEHKRRRGVPNADEDSTAMKAWQRNGATTGESGKSCYFCRKSGHFKQDCAKYKEWKAKKEKANQAESEENQSGFLCFSARQGSGKKDTWYVDSGATRHMTSCRSFLDVFESRKLPDVAIANGLKAKALGIDSGSRHASMEITKR